MGILVSLQNISKSFGSQTLFQNISLGLFEEERLGLIGPNGAGKSTLLKILAGLGEPDDGEVVTKKGIKVTYLGQVDQFSVGQTVSEAVKQTLLDQGVEEIDAYVQTQKVLSTVGFEQDDVSVDILSGGWRKRLSIACALAGNPDLLFLDEPTNHLDLEGILWLEDLLKNASFAFVVITHDRMFLERVCNRVIELNSRYQEGYLKTEGSYSSFVEQRESYIAEQSKKELSLSNKVRNELDWLRRGTKARTTKAKSRIQEAHKLSGELRELKQRNRSERTAQIDFDAADKKSKVLIKVHQACKTLGDKRVLNKINLKLSPGMRVGLLGPNGSGKSTLMKLLSKSLEPDEGSIKYGLDLKVVYFDQDRKLPDMNETLKEALSPSGGDTVLYREKPIHIVTWAKKFLFPVEQLESPVSTLSGGELARVLLARLMLQPADVLLLDEPTNDLDIASLDVLEQSLLEFPGAIVLVTHDRYLMQSVSTHIMALDGNGGAGFFSDLDQWLIEQKRIKNEVSKQKSQMTSTESNNQSSAKPKSRKKLTYKDQFELDHIEGNVMDAEAALDEAKARVSDPAVMSNSEKLSEACDKMNAAQEKVDQLYARWQELEQKLADLDV